MDKKISPKAVVYYAMHVPLVHLVVDSTIHCELYHTLPYLERRQHYTPYNITPYNTLSYLKRQDADHRIHRILYHILYHTISYLKRQDADRPVEQRGRTHRPLILGVKIIARGSRVCDRRIGGCRE